MQRSAGNRPRTAVLQWSLAYADAQGTGDCLSGQTGGSFSGLGPVWVLEVAVETVMGLSES